ncbi:MAG: hemin-degrading factor [Rhodobacteraceae bacterium]|nr:MAG: hemin-degrading factor [Paracoccaceae bacterium]
MTGLVAAMRPQARKTPDPRAVLLAEWRALLDSRPTPPRARDAAETLGVSEGALAEARRLSGEATALRDPGGPMGLVALLGALAPLGPLLALTRNGACVHEKTGVYAAPTPHGSMAQTLGEIDLRLTPAQWVAAYALVEGSADRPRRSLQVFDAHGEAVHKIHATEATDLAAFEALVDAWADPLAPPHAFTPRPPSRPDAPDAAIDCEGLMSAWARLEHSHAFAGLLDRFGVGRAQALRLAEGRFARRLRPEAVEAALCAASRRGVALMVFVGNRGAVQIHSGPVRRVEPMGPWVNVLDPGFNLHLRADRLAGVWLVRKPSIRGEIHGIEAFDGDGALIVQLFGARAPGQPAPPGWRVLVEEVAGEMAC